MVSRDAQVLGQLFVGGIPAVLGEQGPLRPGQLAQLLRDVHGHPDRAGLLGQRPADRLPDPPRGVRGELVPLGVVELLDRPDQAEVALLDDVEQRRAAAGVPLCHGHHEPQVRGGEVLLRRPADRRELHQLRRELRIHGWVGVELVLRVEPGLDALGQLDFFFGSEQRHTADLAQIQPNEIVGSACGFVEIRAVAARPRAAARGRWAGDIHTGLGKLLKDRRQELLVEIRRVESLAQRLHSDLAGVLRLGDEIGDNFKILLGQVWTRGNRQRPGGRVPAPGPPSDGRCGTRRHVILR